MVTSLLVLRLLTVKAAQEAPGETTSVAVRFVVVVASAAGRQTTEASRPTTTVRARHVDGPGATGRGLRLLENGSPRPGTPAAVTKSDISAPGGRQGASPVPDAVLIAGSRSRLLQWLRLAAQYPQVKLEIMSMIYLSNKQLDAMARRTGRES